MRPLIGDTGPSLLLMCATDALRSGKGNRPENCKPTAYQRHPKKLQLHTETPHPSLSPVIFFCTTKFVRFFSLSLSCSLGFRRFMPFFFRIVSPHYLPLWLRRFGVHSPSCPGAYKGLVSCDNVWMCTVCCCGVSVLCGVRTAEAIGRESITLPPPFSVRHRSGRWILSREGCALSAVSRRCCRGQCLRQGSFLQTPRPDLVLVCLLGELFLVVVAFARLLLPPRPWGSPQKTMTANLTEAICFCDRALLERLPSLSPLHSVQRR